MEFKKGNAFAPAASLACGAFRTSLCFAVVATGKMGLEMSGAAPFSVGCVRAVHDSRHLRINRVLQAVFIALVILFFMPAVGNRVESTGVIKVAGGIGI